MNEKMREKVNEGKLDEATYKELVEEMGRLKKEADTAPLFEVTYTVNMITARAHRSYDDDDDENDLHTNQSSFNLHGGPKSKIVRGVTKYRPFSTRGCHATNQFADFDEIIIGADNEPKN